MEEEEGVAWNVRVGSGRLTPGGRKEATPQFTGVRPGQSGGGGETARWPQMEAYSEVR